jgi:uncharacterized protein (DUF1330 family)
MDLTKLLIPKGPAKTFEEHLVKTQVSRSVQEVLETMPDPGPFIMLNLVRFRPHRDPTLYGRYAAVAGREVEKEGSYTPYFAAVIHDLDAAYGFDNSWDEITIPVYSRRASYGLAQASLDYQAALPDRVAGTFQRHLYALSDGAPIFPATLTIQKLHDDRSGFPYEKGNVVIGEFLRFKKPNGRETFGQFAEAAAHVIQDAGGETLLSVECELPVVSEELWDHFTLTRYPSLDAFQKMFTSDEYIAAGRLRRAALDGSISVPTLREEAGT